MICHSCDSRHSRAARAAALSCASAGAKPASATITPAPATMRVRALTIFNFVLPWLARRILKAPHGDHARSPVAFRQPGSCITWTLLRTRRNGKRRPCWFESLEYARIPMRYRLAGGRPRTLPILTEHAEQRSEEHTSELQSL